MGFLSELVFCLVLALLNPETSANVIIALTGDNAILPCSMIPTELAGLVVEWSRSDRRDMIVHINRDGRDLDDQNPYYRGRTTMFLGEMKNGNISLKLTNVEILDSGNYSCYVPSLDSVQKTFVQLLVGAVSQPVISVFGPKDNGVVLKCDSGGWYPEPDLTWLDSDGSILPDGPTETKTVSEGRYTVRGEVTIQKTDDNRFTCRVNQQQINHTMETQIHVPDITFPASPVGLIAGLVIGLIVFVVVAVALGLFTWKRKEKQLKQQAAERGQLLEGLLKDRLIRLEQERRAIEIQEKQLQQRSVEQDELHKDQLKRLGKQTKRQLEAKEENVVAMEGVCVNQEEQQKLLEPELEEQGSDQTELVVSTGSDQTELVVSTGSDQTELGSDQTELVMSTGSDQTELVVSTGSDQTELVVSTGSDQTELAAGTEFERIIKQFEHQLEQEEGCVNKEHYKVLIKKLGKLFDKERAKAEQEYNKAEQEKQLKQQLEELGKKRTAIEEKEMLTKMKLEEKEETTVYKKEPKKHKLMLNIQKKHKPQINMPNAAEFVDKHRDEIIKMFTDEEAQDISDWLLLKGFIKQVSNFRNIFESQPSMNPVNKMTELYTVLDSGGSKVKAGFYSVLQDKYLRRLNDLEMKNKKEEQENH
ncbi:hypothetical protein UPYG_G00246770 [Umbra pygmaea]|uniref:Ig-like domain-containing protein n=1 Tax=Umbra pygmaea TaxID=75934 RepID=A0ABD0WGE1_UMBPY